MVLDMSPVGSIGQCNGEVRTKTIEESDSPIVPMKEVMTLEGRGGQ